MGRPAGSSSYQNIGPEEIEAKLSDLDYAIFGLLPDEGTKVGFSFSVKSASLLLDELNELQGPDAPPVRIGQLNGRLRGLKVGGLAVPVSNNFGGRVDGWQRTARAVELLQAQTRDEEHEEEGS